MQWKYAILLFRLAWLSFWLELLVDPGWKLAGALPIVCSLSPQKGICYAYHTRYYYNKKRDECEKFVYSGCLGNGNRFYTAEECIKMCKSSKVIPVVRTEMPVVCKIPKNPGSCSKRITRYYYNQESHQCETFAYSGCGGNANHFHSEEECRNICKL